MATNAAKSPITIFIASEDSSPPWSPAPSALAGAVVALLLDGCSLATASLAGVVFCSGATAPGGVLLVVIVMVTVDVSEGGAVGIAVPGKRGTAGS